MSGVNARLFSQDKKVAQVDNKYKVGSDTVYESEPEEPVKVKHDER